MKILKHSWKNTGFLTWMCTRCNCTKQKILNNPASKSNPHQYFYYRNGVQLAGLPECKSIIHSDKIT